MLQTLVHIPAEIAGHPLFGNGLLLILWAVVSVATLAWLVWRQGWNADTLGYVPILLLFGAVILWVLPAICETLPNGHRGLPIRGYGMMMLLAVVSGTSLAVWRAKRVGLDPEIILSLALWMFLPGIVGARAFYVIEYWPGYWQEYAGPAGHHNLGMLIGSLLNVANGGLVVYGSFFGGVIGMFFFFRKHRLPLLAMGDLIAPAMLLGLAIGRIGCLMNGCCFGAVCDHDWAVTFPAGTPANFTPPYRAQLDRGQFYGFTLSSDAKASPNVLAVAADSPAARAGLKRGDRLESVNGVKTPETGYVYLAVEEAFMKKEPLRIQAKDRPEVTIAAVTPPLRSLPVHPTQIYSTIDALLLCLLLLAYEPFRRRDGELFALMMSIYPVTRFCIENLRTDEAAVSGTSLSIGQCVSLLILASAAALWIYLLRRPKGTAFHRVK